MNHYEDRAAQNRRAQRTRKGAAMSKVCNYLALLLQCVGGNPADRRPLRAADVLAARVALDEARSFLDAE